MFDFPQPILADFNTVLECASGVLSNNLGLQCGQAVSAAVSDSWDETWTSFLGDPPSGIYLALINLGRLLGVCTFMWFMIRFIRDWVEDGTSTAPLPEFIWVIVVLLFLNNNGYWLRAVSTEIRDVINQVNNQILITTNAAVQFENRLSELGDYPMTEALIRELRSQCNGMTTNLELTQCLDEQRDKAENHLAVYRTAYPGSAWVNRLDDMVDNLFENIGDAVINPIGFVTRPVANFSLSLIIQGFLAALQGA